MEDLTCGAKPGQGSVLADVDEAVIIEACRKTLLPLDDLYDLLNPLIPVLARSNLHRCLQRHGVNRLADLLLAEEKGQTKTFKDYAPGHLHIDSAQINLGKDKYYLLVAIDRATRYVYLELHDNKRMETAAVSLQDQDNPHRQWYRVQLQPANRRQETQKQGASGRQNLP